MSSFAQTQSGSVRAITRMFDNISASMIFTNIEPPVHKDSKESNSSTNGNDLKTTDKEEVLTSNVVTTDIVDGSKIDDSKQLDNEATENEFVGPATVLEKDKSSSDKIPGETKVYKHMKEYPIVYSWIKIFHWVPTPRVIRPTLMSVAYSNTLAPYTDGIDTFFDNRLGQLDATFPFIRELRMRDIRNVILDDPIKAVSARTSKTLMDVSNLTQKMIVEPSRNGIHQLRDLRGEYMTLGDNQPIIRSQINPLIKQVNSRMVDNINKFFPQMGDDMNLPLSYVSVDDKSNELSYTFQLINIGMLRSRPVLQERLEELISTPNNAAKHVAAVYQESKLNRGEGRIVVVIATVETIRKLADEGYTLLSASTFFQFLQTSPLETEKMSIAEETRIEPKEIEVEKEVAA